MIEAQFTEFKRYLDTELNFEYDVKPGVVLDGIKPLAWYAIRLVGRVISNKCQDIPVLTSGKRDVSGQITAMENMKREHPDLYKQVYGRMLERGQDPATMPHPEGRAGDWRFREYEEAESTLIELNAWYLQGAKIILGYPSSSLIVPEKQDGDVVCYHGQVPRQVPDELKFRDYLTATFGRV